MLSLANGLALLFNGALSSVRALATPVTIAVLVTVVALGQLASIEVHELNRQSTKPTIGRH